MTTQHTPKLRVYGPEEPGLIVVDTIGSPIMAQVIRESAEESNEFAETIVRSCNAHDELVAALESIAEDRAVYAPELQRIARAALAKVQK